MEFDLQELLGRVQTEPTENAGKLIVAYSSPGAGKTSTFAQAGNALLVECKDYSSDALKESGIIRRDLPVLKAKGYDDGVSIIKALSGGGHNFKNVIIDGASGMSDWLDADILERDFEGDAARFAAWGKGSAQAAIRWREFADAVVDLVLSGVWVFLLAHKAVITEKNPDGNDYLKSSPAIHKDKLAPFSRYVDAVLFIDLVIGEKTVDKITGTAKVAGGNVRVMYTQLSASYEAKNRLNLPPMIQLGGSAQDGFKAFREAVKAGKKSKQESK